MSRLARFLGLIDSFDHHLVARIALPACLPAHSSFSLNVNPERDSLPTRLCSVTAEASNAKKLYKEEDKKCDTGL